MEETPGAVGSTETESRSGNFNFTLKLQSRRDQILLVYTW